MSVRTKGPFEDRDDGIMCMAPLDPALAERLRAEAHGMAEAYVDALLAETPKDAIAGVYLKGSSQRTWETDVDYVPELSDVDIHVRLSNEAPIDVQSLHFALRVGDSALTRFERRFPSAKHTPRAQLRFLDDLESLPGYLPSPSGCVTTLYGAEYRAGTRAEYADCAASDGRRFASDARFVLHELASKVIDRPGELLWRVVSTLTWRVGPSGPRLLTQLGMPPYDAWSLNRSAVVRELVERGHESLANHYAGFYRAGWEGFRSGFTDHAPARRALLALHGLCREGLHLMDAQSFGTP